MRTLKYVLDVHTHSIVSGHAYSTLFENINEAAKKGIKALGTSEHGPNMPGGPHMFYFYNMDTLPRVINGVTILRGCEANIINHKGEIDITDKVLPTLDYIIGSLHDVCIKPGSRDENTEAYIKAMESRKIDIIGHPGNPSFPIWEEELVKKAKEMDIIIEINNGSFNSREGSEVTCSKIAALCNKYKAKIILGSDAHICYNVGEFSLAEKILVKEKVSEELIMNLDEKRFFGYLKAKGRLTDVLLA